MRWLLFLSRLAFICGIFFLLSISLLFKDWAKDQATVSTIVIIGHVMGMILVPLVNICYLVVLIWKRMLRVYVPLWLIIGNILMLGILALYIFLQNG
jgi:hypothetical protein